VAAFRRTIQECITKEEWLDGLEPLEPIYTLADAEESLKYFISIAYGVNFKVSDEIQVMLRMPAIFWEAPL